MTDTVASNLRPPSLSLMYHCFNPFRDNVFNMVDTSVAPIIRSVIGNTLCRLILSIRVLDLYTYQIASRSIWLLNGS